MQDSYLAEEISLRERGTGSVGPDRGLYRRLLLIVLVALALRLLVMCFQVPDRLDPSRDHWRFAWETGRIARSIATGHGYSSPFIKQTGATAWLPPLFPWLLSQVFRIFGVYTMASAVAILSLNSLFSALTCIPVFFIARRTFDETIATRSAWVWAFFPYSVYLGSGRIWENTLTTLLTATILMLVLQFERESRLLPWIGFGVLAGIAALCNPNILAVLPFLLAWTCMRRRKAQESWKLQLVLSLAALVLVLTPWEVRNYKTFGKFIPIRGNFWAEVRNGNTGDTSDLYPDWAIPSTGANEWQVYAQLGEVGYMARQRTLALDFIHKYPGEFVWLCVRRFGYVWTGFWSLSQPYSGNEPFQIPNTVLCSAITLAMLVGLRRAWRGDREKFLPFLVLLALVPATYYITHPAMEYRHPLDPVIVVLAVYGLAKWKKPARSADGMEAEDREAALAELSQ